MKNESLSKLAKELADCVKDVTRGVVELTEAAKGGPGSGKGGDGGESKPTRGNDDESLLKSHFGFKSTKTDRSGTPVSLLADWQERERPRKVKAGIFSDALRTAYRDQYASHSEDGLTGEQEYQIQEHMMPSMNELLQRQTIGRKRTVEGKVPTKPFKEWGAGRAKAIDDAAEDKKVGRKVPKAVEDLLKARPKKTFWPKTTPPKPE